TADGYAVRISRPLLSYLWKVSHSWLVVVSLYTCRTGCPAKFVYTVIRFPSARVSTVFVRQALYPSAKALVVYANVVVSSPPVQAEHPVPCRVCLLTRRPAEYS